MQPAQAANIPNKLMDFPKADIPENFIQQISSELLKTLLVDHTMSTPKRRKNIFWATSDYESRGKGYQYNDPIMPKCITGKNGQVIMPRVLKAKSTQLDRSHSMAEVFTPPWICNVQLNQIDEKWFGRPNVFNKEIIDSSGNRSWVATTDKIEFPAGKTWRDYIRDNRLEITCGEAPYIASRYDTTTGLPIPISQRIGILDRKLRVVSENTTKSGEWLKAAQQAFMSTYAYEWQGDNLLLAREAMLISFIEYYKEKFGKMPLLRSMQYIAYIVSWNVWQMDGLKGVVPNTCHAEEMRVPVLRLFDEAEVNITQIPCPGCDKNDYYSHNGTYCLIRDWRKKREKSRIRFIDLLTR